MVCNNLGFTYDLQRNYSKASEYYLRALPLARSVGDRRGEATLLSNLGFLREKQGDLEEAATLYEQAILIREHIRPPPAWMNSRPLLPMNQPNSTPTRSC